uniref:Metalloendopeptidase n=1 Tax=Acrobeloides nanus TaxID=290746 RepID=A0A914DRQ6_9BILA
MKIFLIFFLSLFWTDLTLAFGFGFENEGWQHSGNRGAGWQGPRHGPENRHNHWAGPNFGHNGWSSERPPRWHDPGRQQSPNWNFPGRPRPPNRERSEWGGVENPGIPPWGNQPHWRSGRNRRRLEPNEWEDPERTRWPQIPPWQGPGTPGPGMPSRFPRPHTPPGGPNGWPQIPTEWPGPGMPRPGPRFPPPRHPPPMWPPPPNTRPPMTVPVPQKPPPPPQSFQEPPMPAFVFQLPPPTQQIFFRNIPKIRPPTASLRQIIENAEIATHKIIEPSPFVADTIHQRLDLMHSLKQRLFDSAGIGSQISAPDDGTFWTDLVLNEDQAFYLMDRLNTFRRKKRYSVFFEGFPVYRWDVNRPIPYTFDANVAAHERTIVHNALRQIEAKTCIRFRFYPTKPSSNYIYYTKMANPALCGLSYIGRTFPANPIYLSFSCPDFAGVIIHETMHALGVNHHHQRSDRDKYIRINWQNIDPTKYDYFAAADPTIFTTYGVPYDYYSIMAYSPKVGTLPPYNRPSITPLQNPSRYLPFIGQRRFISNGDAALLNKMYCKRPSCVDRNVYCGAWANQNLCRTPAQYGWMVQNCQKSCGFC